MSEANVRRDYLRQGTLVIVLALLYGFGLAAVHVGLEGRIAENRRRETHDQIPHLVAGADLETTREHRLSTKTGDVVIYEARDAAGERLGWVLPGSGTGFADRIQVLIGVTPDLGTLTGLFVLEQKETPGLGDYITDEERFLRQFAGKPTEPSLLVVKRAAEALHEVRALTGATVSSEAVSDIVNRTLAELTPRIRELEEH